MNSPFRIPHSRTWVIAGGLALLVTGCNNIFMPKHRVLVDAISAPGYVPTMSGTSYRLLAKKSVVTTVQAQVSVIKACVDAALAGKGMYEPPASVAPDVFIEVAYGVDTTPRVDASARETFLQLSARANPTKAVERGTGPELWDVRVAVLGIAGRLETAMPLLSAVAADYMGTDTKLEKRVEIPQNSPVVGSVRESAIRALEGGAAGSAPQSEAAARAAVEPVKTK